MDSNKLGWVVAGALLLGFAVIAFLILGRLSDVERQMGLLSKQVDQAVEKASRSEDRAVEAEKSALEAARGRLRAEEAREAAREAAQRALQDADQARLERDDAVAEADRIKREREEELDRLQKALGRIADTRRNALGLVMNLGSESLTFDFDKATLRPENREILSRIAGVLLTFSDYSVYVYGHTDNVGSQAYNQRLSERRAETVRDYLVEAGVESDIIATKGFGKSQPLVPGNSPEARAKNRRVEIGIVNARVRYEGPADR